MNEIKNDDMLILLLLLLMYLVISMTLNIIVVQDYII